MTIEEIIRAIPLQVSSRTVQRRLMMLADGGWLHRSGRARAMRYALVPPAERPEEYRAGREEETRGASRRPTSGQGSWFAFSGNGAPELLPIALRGALALKPAAPDIAWTWQCCRLEGNRSSLLAAVTHMEAGGATGIQLRDMVMLENHRRACAFMAAHASQGVSGTGLLQNLHALLTEHLLPRPREEGRFTDGAVEELLAQVIAEARDQQDPLEGAFRLLSGITAAGGFAQANAAMGRLAAALHLLHHRLRPPQYDGVAAPCYRHAVLHAGAEGSPLLREVFSWGCHRAAGALVEGAPPDPVALRHREALHAVAALVIRGLMPPGEGDREVHRFATTHIPASDRQRFEELAGYRLLTLHHGILARTGLSAAEYDAWRGRWRLEIP